MSGPTLPLPSRPPRAQAQQLGLDARILQVEQRLIARQDRLGRQLGLLGARVRRAWQPRRLLAPLLITSLGLGLVWLWRGRAGAALPAHGPAARTPEHGGRGGGAWLQWLGLLWPLLPAGWRSRVPAPLVNLMMGFGLPLLDSLAQRTPPPPLATAGPLDLAQLAGHWYELARLPAWRGEGQAQWQHVLHGSDGIDLLQERVVPGAALRRLHAVARVLPGSGGARWHVSDWPPALRWLPGTWHELAVLHLDAAATELLLGSPGRERLRLLSRQPQLAPERLHALLDIARERGFDVQRIPRRGPG